MTRARDLADSASAFNAVSAIELGYVDGVTSSIQTQINTLNTAINNVDPTPTSLMTMGA